MVSVPHHVIPSFSANAFAEVHLSAIKTKLPSLLKINIFCFLNIHFAWKTTFLKFNSTGIKNTLSKSFHEEKSVHSNSCLIILVSKDSKLAFISSYSLRTLSSLSASCVCVLIHNFSIVVSRISWTS